MSRESGQLGVLRIRSVRLGVQESGRLGVLRIRSVRLGVLRIRSVWCPENQVG